jgi:hypothetical protein
MTNTKPLHTRFRFAPTGDVHLGHLAVCWLSYHAARQTGGTYFYRCDQLLSTTSRDRWEWFHSFARRNIDDLCDFGFPPTAPVIIRDFDGLHPGMRMEITDDRAMADHYYRELGFDELFGDWPPPAEADDRNWKALILGNYEQVNLHPYILVAQVVGDIITRRNCLIRGDDILPDRSFTNAIAQAIAKKHFNLTDIDHTAEYTFLQHFIPKIRRSGSRLPSELRESGGTVLGSSKGDITAPFYVRHIIERGVDPQDVLDLLGRVMFGSTEASACVYDGWKQGIQPVGGQTGGGGVIQHTVREIIDRLVPNPVIDDEEWFDLIG